MIHSPRGGLVILAGLSVALVAATPARSPRIVDVRVGVHAGHTRVVLELDSPSAHRVERQEKTKGTLAVHLDARTERRRIVSSSPLVEAVTLDPGDAGAVARIVLRERGLDYSELVLDAPPRVVIDVRRPSAAAKAPARRSADVAAIEPGPAEAPPGPLAVAPAAREESEPARAPQAAAANQAPDPQPAAREGRDPFAPPASYDALVAAQRAGTEEGAAGSVPPPQVAEPAPEMAEVASLPGKDTAPEPSPPRAPAAKPLPPVSAPAPLPPAAEASPAVEAILARLANAAAELRPIHAVVAVAAVLAGWLLQRRLAARRTRLRALEESEEGLAIFGDAGAAALEEQRSPEAIAPAPMEILTADAEEAPARRLALLVPDDEPIETERPREPRQGWQSIPVPPAEAAAEAIAAPDDEYAGDLTQRIVRLEEQIAELAESRERLERFAAAQNEELRVQRAAIARTQRVLRSIARADEPGAEPGGQPTLPLSGD